ncbi:TIGR03936 family radical SAM-associated protein [Evtepia sp.]|uniref:TIGR03936 family radical SAM-associated protein n=1 Tax=Evtepia sp. TaxID=2773933 RepID=UPI002A83CC0B|nr:TIGR03936 family radical SAM-associated protein [Evtepia sp.]MDY3992853.1 TIGR03936 family radical SAM-associated protein [Evtepia sp.]MDY4429441.1 TIGR03936 family radical SAM-associated protein [Evtepia sp.]
MSDQRILFTKSGTAKYISHLDLMHTMERAFLRAGITIRHTAGFHPHPYVSIPLPLPLGFSSQCELLEFGLVEGSTVEELPQKMNRALPAGIQVRQCYDGGLPFKKLAYVRYDITLEFETPLADQAAQAFRELLGRESFVVQKRSKKAKSGFTEVDIIPLVEAVEEIRPEGTFLYLTLLLKAQNPGLNPDVLLQGFRGEHPELPMIYTACHRREILDEDKNIYR